MSIAPAVLKEGGRRVAEDHEPLTRRDDHPLGAIAAVLVDGPDIVAELRDPSRPFKADGRRTLRASFVDVIDRSRDQRRTAVHRIVGAGTVDGRD